MKTSPLFGILVGRRYAPHCVCWLLPLREGGLRMRLDLLQEYAYSSF